MNIAFLVGNGFDMSVGVDSSYNSFYKWYCEKKCTKDSVVELKKQIKSDIEQGRENWSDFELGLGQYTAKFNLDSIDDFFEAYENAHEELINYLNIEKQNFNEDILSDDSIEHFKNSLVKFCGELPDKERNEIQSVFDKVLHENHWIYFISFNYTDILDQCIEKLIEEPLEKWTCQNTMHKTCIIPEVIHVHGTHEKFPIFGVNDKSQIANQELLQDSDFCSIMIKPQSVETISESWHDKAKQIIQTSHIICVFGMSLGASDAQWWKEIARRLEKSNSHLVVFWHSKEPENRISILNYKRNVTKIRKIIADYGEWDSQQIEQISKRIHIIVNTANVLKLPVNAKEKEIIEV